MRVLDWSKAQDGMKATLSLENGEGPVARERVSLGSSRSRKGFLEHCPVEQKAILEKTLMRLEDHLRAKVAQSQGMKPSEAPPISLSEGEKQEALVLLQNPNVLLEFLQDTEKLGFVGEEDNKTYLLLAYTSRLLDSPINTTIKGESAAGKNYETESVADFIPPESVIKLTGATAKAFFYTTQSLKHKVILIAERPGAEDSDYSIRTMQSEKRIVFWVPQKGQDGKIKTEEKIVEGPAAFVETTTKTHLHPENETRNFDIYVDDSEAHTEKVFEAQDRRYTNPMHPELKQRILKRWHNAQRLLQPYPVLIPFVRKITFPAKPLRVRRDRPRFMGLIEASAVLHQHQREKRELDGISYLVASTKDYAIARELAVPILKHVLRGATPKCVQLVQAAQGIGQEGNQFTRADLESELKWDRKTVDKYLKEALRLGCIDKAEEGGRGRGNASRFTFAKPVEEVDVPLPDPATLETSGT